jgi:Skp family chaperone for outer membrane proteins
MIKTPVKRLAIALAFGLSAAGLSAVPAAAQQLAPAVIVIVDMDRVFNESAAGKQAATELQGRMQQLQARATTLQQQLTTEAQAIQQGQQNNSLTGQALEQRTQAFGQRQQAAQQELGQSEEQIGRARNFVLQQLDQATQPIITQVMRERNAQVALRKEATLQHSAALEVTNDVIARLNQSLPRVSTTPPAPQQQQQPQQQQPQQRR